MRNEKYYFISLLYIKVIDNSVILFILLSCVQLVHAWCSVNVLPVPMDYVWAILLHMTWNSSLCLCV